MKTIFAILKRTIWCILYIPIMSVSSLVWFFGTLSCVIFGSAIYFILTGKQFTDSKIWNVISEIDWAFIPANWIYKKLK